MNIINCKNIADATLKETKIRTTHYTQKNHRAPHLSVIMVGENEASNRYVRNKERDCNAVGIETDTIRLPKNIAPTEVLNLINKLNHDDNVDAIIVQLPLPPHFNEDTIINAIDPSKDADGLTIMNTGYQTAGSPRVLPCTVHGIVCLIKTLQKENKISNNATICIVGRSKIVGRPLAIHLMNMQFTVIECNSKTHNIKELTKAADVVVLATGQSKFFDQSYFKDNQVIIDVGINRDKSGKLCGDVNTDDLIDMNVTITPVPGGIGLLTRAFLCYNTIHLRDSDPKYTLDICGLFHRANDRN